MSASAIYEGVVMHRRRAPVAHAFGYRIFLMYLDLDELPELFDGHPLFSARRPAPAWFRRADYLGDPAIPLADAVRDLVGERLGARPAGPVRMLAHLRYLGHCFNPVAFYWCFDAAGERVEAVVAEVTSTPWGERHAYVAAATPGDGEQLLESRHDKAMHVSPFMAMAMEYRWRISTPGEELRVGIENRQDGEPVFDARLALRRRSITRGALTRVLARHPAMTLRVVAAIYAQALRLRLKGARWHARPVERRQATTASSAPDPAATPALTAPASEPSR